LTGIRLRFFFAGTRRDYFSSPPPRRTNPFFRTCGPHVPQGRVLLSFLSLLNTFFLLYPQCLYPSLFFRALCLQGPFPFSLPFKQSFQPAPPRPPRTPLVFPWFIFPLSSALPRPPLFLSIFIRSPIDPRFILFLLSRVRDFGNPFSLYLLPSLAIPTATLFFESRFDRVALPFPKIGPPPPMPLSFFSLPFHVVIRLSSHLRYFFRLFAFLFPSHCLTYLGELVFLFLSDVSFFFLTTWTDHGLCLGLYIFSSSLWLYPEIPHEPSVMCVYLSHFIYISFFLLPCPSCIRSSPFVTSLLAEPLDFFPFSFS